MKFIKWSIDNKFQLNLGKCKELRINFATQPYTDDPQNINGKPFETVESAKVLGVALTSDLKWIGTSTLAISLKRLLNDFIY